MTTPRGRCLTALLAAALAVPIAGCGGGSSSTAATTGSSSTTTTSSITETSPPGASSEPATTAKPAESDPQQVDDAINAVLSSPDSETVCASAITSGALKSFYGSRQACLNGRAKPTLADSVKVWGLQIDGDTATAKAKPKGGLYDGITVEVTAVRDPDGWRIDGLDANVPVGP